MSIAAPVAGESKLEKLPRLALTPAAPGTPGALPIPGIQAQFARFVSQPIVAPSGEGLPAGTAFQLINENGTLIFVPVVTRAQAVGPIVQPGGSLPGRVLVAAIAGTPDTPAIPNTDGATAIIQRIGWDASGRTAVEVSTQGRFDFFAPLNLVGAVVGTHRYLTTDYASLAHGLYLSHGRMLTIEHGTLVDGPFPYLDTDKLTIVIGANGIVTYEKNGVAFSTSSLRSNSFARLVACLYHSGDAIYDIAAVAHNNVATRPMMAPQAFALSVGKNYVRSPSKALTTTMASYPNRARVDGATMRVAKGFALSSGKNLVSSEIRIQSTAVSSGSAVRAPMLTLSSFSADRKMGNSSTATSMLASKARSGGLAPVYGIAHGRMMPMRAFAPQSAVQHATSATAMLPLIGTAARTASGLGRYGSSAAAMLPVVAGVPLHPVGYVALGSTFAIASSMQPAYALILGTFTQLGITATFVGQITLPQAILSQLTASSTMSMKSKFLVSLISSLSVSSTTTATLRLVNSIVARMSGAAGFTAKQLMHVVMHEVLNARGRTEAEGLVNDVAQTWVTNVKRGPGQVNATTRYENFDFNSFARFGGRYYAARADGIYELDGDDDDGDEIRASIDFGDLKFGTNGLKRPTNAFIGATSSGALVLKVEASAPDGTLQDFLYTARSSSPDAATQRFDFGKGLSGNFLNFELFNGSGEDFDLESIEFMLMPLSRRVR